MVRIYKFFYGCFYIFNSTHRLILPFILLIFLTSCGYKGDPTYTVYDQNKSVKEVKTYKKLERW